MAKQKLIQKEKYIEYAKKKETDESAAMLVKTMKEVVKKKQSTFLIGA